MFKVVVKYLKTTKIKCDYLNKIWGDLGLYCVDTSN